MLSRLFIFTFSILLFCSNNVAADDNNIQNDTIRIPEGRSVLINLPGEIQTARTLCNKADYNIMPQSSFLEVRTNLQANGTYCTMFVVEGDQATGTRNHVFVLVTVSATVAVQAIHDLSTVKKIQERKANGQKNIPQPAGQPGTSSSGNSAASTGPTAPPPPPGSANIDSAIYKIDQEALKKQIKGKVDVFYKCCERISRKMNVPETITTAMVLFNNDEDKFVESVSKNSGQRATKKIKDYLTKLSQLSYSKVKITGGDIQYISNITKNVDGTYRATAKLFQLFEGFNGERPVYRDKTTKTFEVIVVMNEMIKEGKQIYTWDVFLGDIKVEELQ